MVTDLLSLDVKQSRYNIPLCARLQRNTYSNVSAYMAILFSFWGKERLNNSTLAEELLPVQSHSFSLVILQLCCQETDGARHSKVLFFICISKAFHSSVSHFELFRDDRWVNKKHRLEQIKKVVDRENRGEWERKRKKCGAPAKKKSARKINKTDTLFHCQWHSGVIWSTYLCTVSRTIPASKND